MKNISLNAPEGREHVYSFDYIRSVALFFVVFMHVGAGPIRLAMGAGWHALNICMSLAFTAVPLFFMMSGYLLLTDPRTTDISFLLRSRIPKLLLTLAVWTVVAAAWSSLVNVHDLSLFLTNLISALHQPAWVHLWYMYTLIGLYLISPVLYAAIHGMNESGRKYLLALVLVVCLQGFAAAAVPAGLRDTANVSIIRDFMLFGGHISSFILGYYIGSLKKRIPVAVIAAAGAADLAFIVIGTWHDSVLAGEYSSAFQLQSAGPEIILAACIFLFFRQRLNKDSRLRRALSPLVALSLGMYLMHNFLLSFMHVYIWNHETAKHVLPVTLIIIAISYIITKTLTTIPAISYIFTGIPFKQACGSCNWIFTFRNIKGFLKSHFSAHS